VGKLLNDIKTYPKEFLISLLLDQLDNNTYIEARCKKCIYHSEIFYDNQLIHICNDIWSGIDHSKEAEGGKHIFYFETKDICIECDGFKAKE
jgi:hypothetical protein